MGTITAQILIGKPHIYHEGINPTHFLFLSENSRPAWIMVPQNIFPDVKNEGERVVWIPTIENMLDDALLMIGIKIIKNPAICKLFYEFSSSYNDSPLEIYSCFNKEQLTILYDESKKIKNWPKLVITVLNESHIKKLLPSIKAYKVEFEICTIH